MSHSPYDLKAYEWSGVCKHLNLASNHDSESFRKHPSNTHILRLNLSILPR